MGILEQAWGHKNEKCPIQNCQAPPLTILRIMKFNKHELFAIEDNRAQAKEMNGDQEDRLGGYENELALIPRKRELEGQLEGTRSKKKKEDYNEDVDVDNVAGGSKTGQNRATLTLFT